MEVAMQCLDSRLVIQFNLPIIVAKLCCCQVSCDAFQILESSLIVHHCPVYFFIEQSV